MPKSSVFEKRYLQLNERQKEAVDAIEGPVMVIAGPGSGKTELLGLRVANILRRSDARPEDILCLTFTDAAARNMRERLAGLIGPEAYKVAIHTFHSFGSEVINRHRECFYQGAVFAPIDQITKTEIIEEVVKDLKWHSRLKSYHPEQGYTYLGDIIGRIDDIKKGGLAPEEFAQLLEENRAFEQAASPLFERAFRERVSADMLGALRQLVADLLALPVDKREHPLPNYRPLKSVVIENLEQALADADAILEKRSKTKPVTAFKQRFLKKDAKGGQVLASSTRTKELLDLAQVYAAYQERINQQGFYDFADMILDTVRALETDPELCYELQEKYLYLLVDEFQDTSGVQMRLLDALLDSETNEGRPNVLMVGDDDQSIYKFQGANLANLNDFLGKYRDVKKVVLTHNYRSTPQILEYARSVIGKAEDRLTNRDAEIVKELVAANGELKGGAIIQKELATKTEQFIYVAETIKRRREAEPESGIAIIARGHKDLEGMAAILGFYGIPVQYERERDVLQAEHIREILVLAYFVDSLDEKGRQAADEYLPEILAFPFFGVDRIDLWRVSVQADRNRKTWLEIMLGYGGRVGEIAEWLIALGAEAKRRTMEEMLDFITGTRPLEGVAYRSGFREYYFSKEKFEKDRLNYLEYLSDLSALFGKLREYRTRETLYIKDLVGFVKLHETHRLPIHNSQHLSRGKDAVELLTAHKAKGLEFDSVFIINCNENAWMKNHGGGKLLLPANIPLTAEADSLDDKIRIFFVAVTRAKRHLCLTNYATAPEEKKTSERLRFLDPDLATEEIEALPEEKLRTAEDLLLLQEDLRHYELKDADEKELLASLLENYKLSATHLNNFLNVKTEGPAGFLERNLLRFPSAKNANSSYGTAVHDSFTELYKRFKERGKLPKKTELLELFADKLRLQGLNTKDYTEKLEQGRDELGAYYDKYAGELDQDDLLDIDFKSEGALVGGAAITGKIDRMALVDKKERIYKVFDYKTGRHFDKWNPSDAHLKVNAYKYRNQLIFYKLLIENSRSFGKYEVEEGCLDFIAAREEELIRMEHTITPEDVERMKKLIGIVYGKIMALDFPDVSKYSQDLEGIVEFEEDLLAGNI